MHFTLASAVIASVFLPYVFISSKLMGTPRDVTWWEAPCHWDWFIPSICSAVVPTDPVQPAPHASPPHIQTLTSWRALLTLRIGSIPPRCGNFICKTSPESFHRYPIEFRLRCELMMQWVIPHAVSRRQFSADVFTMSYSSTNNQTFLH